MALSLAWCSKHRRPAQQLLHHHPTFLGNLVQDISCCTYLMGHGLRPVVEGVDVVLGRAERVTHLWQITYHRVAHRDDLIYLRYDRTAHCINLIRSLQHLLADTGYAIRVNVNTSTRHDCYPFSCQIKILRLCSVDGHRPGAIITSCG